MIERLLVDPRPAGAVAARAPFELAGSVRQTASTVARATARSSWLTIRHESETNSRPSSSGRDDATFERTRIVSPIRTGRLKVTESSPRSATTRSGSNGIRPTA